MNKLLLFLLFSTSIFAGDVRTYNMLPGTCMYIQGHKVCAMATQSQYIIVDNMSLPLGVQRQVNTVPVLATIQGKQNVCQCDMSSVNREGYTIEKTIEEKGEKKTTFIKVMPDVSSCSCQIINQ